MKNGIEIKGIRSIEIYVECEDWRLISDVTEAGDRVNRSNGIFNWSWQD